MPGPGPQQRAVQLLGRERECAAIDRVLAGAHGGSSATLVLRGEAGIGKSALLAYARQQAASMTVLAVGGVEAESDLAFAGLHGLLRPILGYLGELPETQSQSRRWPVRLAWHLPLIPIAC
jgi:predicted ATPase